MNPFDRLKAALARDGEADPQAKDERTDPWAETSDVGRETPDKGDIEEWTEEYKVNPLINKPTDKYTADILEPGVSANVDADADGEDGDTEAEEIPTVSGYHDDAYNGLRLDKALEKWFSEAGIVDGEYGHDVTDVFEKVIKDMVGRRGTSMTEVVYDDAAEKNVIKGVRPFKSETVTAYTHVGKNILLQPDDTPEDVAVSDGMGNSTHVPGSLPETKAGDTATYVQFDDIFNAEERDQVALSLDDVVKVSNDADTGEIFGKPATATVFDRAKGIRQQYKDLDQAIKTVAYSHWIANVQTDDEDEARNLLQSFNPGNPEKINVVNYAVETEQFDGSVPDIEPAIKQQIEYVLSAFPVPIYRIGFEGEINRDVSSEQGSDYTRELSEARDSIASQFDDVVQRKADEFMGGSAPPSTLDIEPDEETNPLKDEEFAADEFKATMQGIKQVAPGGAAEMILPPDTVLETFLGLDPEDVLGSPNAETPLDEMDPNVREAFSNAYDLPSDSEGESDGSSDGSDEDGETDEEPPESDEPPPDDEEDEEDEGGSGSAE